MQVTVAVDAMGGDHGPAVTVPAALAALRHYDSLRIILVGDRELLETEFGSDLQHPRVTVVAASQQVGMAELPSSALRNKRDSSMRIAIEQVKSGQAEACVSAGNTGALMAIARFVLKTLPGIDRPAICTALPTRMNRVCRVLDLGANLDCSADELYQFAVMGSVLVRETAAIEHPTVGLLNVGEEEIKGNDHVKRASALLSASPLNYIGFVEGNDIFEAKADVVVCDGFVGNVALKATEGAARMIGHFTREEFSRNWKSKLAAWLARPVLNRLKQRIDPRKYNGASLLGLKGVVVKSHGSADVLSFTCAIEEAMLEGRRAMPDRIGSAVENLLAERNVG